MRAQRRWMRTARATSAYSLADGRANGKDVVRAVVKAIRRKIKVFVYFY